MTEQYKSRRVALVGASDDAEKYSHKAFVLLREKGYEVFPIHPKLKAIDGVSVYRSIEEVPGPVDTVSLYVSKDISSKIGQSLLKSSPKRIIFNPGAENDELFEQAACSGIAAVNACTLVLLKTGQF